MKLLVDGRGEVNPTQREFVASGGEADVYVLGDTAFKVYKDPKRALAQGKFAELQVLADVPQVVRPERLLLDGRGVRVYTMRFVRDHFVACQLFPRAFRERHGLKAAAVGNLVLGMQATLAKIHERGVLVVDLNEMNLLVDLQFKEIVFLDADSYQTRSYPATALMESVRDRHAKGFDVGTDWFAFAVVTFQMFVGVHPYKGTHPKLRGLDERMAADVSVFHSSVRVPAVCYPLDVIPAAWRAWYQATFEDRLRAAPPERLEAAPSPRVWPAAPPLPAVVLRGKLTMTAIHEFADPIREVWWHDGMLVVLTDRYLYVQGHAVESLVPDDVLAVSFTRGTGPIVLTPAGLLWTGPPKALVPLHIRRGPVMDHEGTTYAQVGDLVVALDHHENGVTTTRLAVE